MDGGADTIQMRRAEGIAPVVGQGERVPVKVARLDSHIPSDGNFRLLKLDCEGSELAILKDLKDAERLDSIAVEYHEHAYSIQALMDCLLGFGTHQVYAVHGDIIHGVRTDVLLDHARNLN